jgi:hypothetical protein
MVTPTTMKVSLGLALLALLASTAARAEEAAPPAGAPETRGPSERLKVLSGDLTAIGLFAAGAAVEGKDGGDTPLADGLRYAALGGYLLAGPAIHAQHGHPGRAIVSLFLRAALPVAGAYIGRSTATCTDEFLCGLKETAMGFLAGTALASTIDIALLSSATLGAGDAEPERTPRAGLTLAPQIAVTPQMAFAGLGGRF